MRISTLQLYAQGVSSILDQQANVAKYQQQVSTGKRIQTPADDPAGAARVLQLGQALGQNTQYQTNADAVNSRLTQEESALTSAGNNLQRVRDLVVQGLNAPLGNQDRASIAQEIRQRLDEMKGLANSRDGQGDYLFGGYKTKGQPFTTDASGQVVYNGDQGTRYLQISPDRQVADSDPGQNVFMGIRNGNGTFVANPASANTGTGSILPGSVVDSSAYQPDSFRIVFTSANSYNVVDDTTGSTVQSGQAYQSGAKISFNGIETSISGQPAAGDTFTVAPSTSQSVFTTLDNIATAMETPTGTPANAAKLTSLLNRSLSEIDQASSNFVNIRTSIGARQNAIDSQKQINSDVNVQLQTDQSTLQSADMVQAVSDLARSMNSLQASQEAFAKTQGLSLFQYIK